MYTQKDRVRVVIITSEFQVEGDFHLLAGSRLTDSLNSKSKDFFAVTDAKVYRPGIGTPVYSPSYIAVNRSSIAAILPIDEVG